MDPHEVEPLNPIGFVLVGVYGSCFFLVLLFYVVEDAPWHYSRRVESVYLSTVLVVMYTASVWFAGPLRDVTDAFRHPWSQCNMLLLGCDEDSEESRVMRVTLRALLALRHIAMLIVTIYIMENFCKPGTTPAFFVEGFGRCPKKEQALIGLVSRQPVVVRLARELNETIDDIKEVTRIPTLLPSAPQSQSLVILVLLLLSDVSVVLPGISAHVFWVCRVIQVCLWLYIFANLATGWWKYGAFVDRATQLVEQVVQESNDEALKYLLATVNVGSLLEMSRDMLDLLTREALKRGMLDCTEKAMFIYALQNIGLPRSRYRQEAVQRLLLGTHQQELTELKGLLDGTGNYHNLYKLVYYDISVETIRSSILHHLKAQARLVRAAPGFTALIKVCSDIDDTLYSSGGRFPAGCDKRLPKGVIYPGCLSLFRALDKGWQPGARSSNLAFLSARPHVYKSWAENKSYDVFKELVVQESMHSMPTMIPGKLGLGLWAMVTYPCLKNLAWRRVGEFKYQTYLRFASLYLEYDFVFCGDDGQGDLWAGQRMVLNRKSARVLDEAVSEEERDRDCSPSSEESDTDSRGASSAPASTFEAPKSGAGDAAAQPDLRLLARSEVKRQSAPLPVTRAMQDAHETPDEAPLTARTCNLGALPHEEWLRMRSWTNVVGGRMRGVLIHEVLDRSKHEPLQWRDDMHMVETAGEEVSREWLAEHKLFFHRTYVGAAVALHVCDPDLVSLDTLERVSNDAMQELEEAMLMYPEMEGKWKSLEEDLQRDLQAAEGYLVAAGREPFRVMRTPTEVMNSTELGTLWTHSLRSVGIGEVRRQALFNLYG